jgi:hypothetical protein
MIIEQPDGQCGLALNHSLGNRPMLAVYVPRRAYDRELISVALGAIKQEVIEVHQPAQAAAGQ